MPPSQSQATAAEVNALIRQVLADRIAAKDIPDYGLLRGAKRITVRSDRVRPPRSDKMRCQQSRATSFAWSLLKRPRQKPSTRRPSFTSSLSTNCGLEGTPLGSGLAWTSRCLEIQSWSRCVVALGCCSIAGSRTVGSSTDGARPSVPDASRRCIGIRAQIVICSADQ